jgi:hypothetical protein
VEELPRDMPPPKGPAEELFSFVDADHAHDWVTWRSVTRILLFRWVCRMAYAITSWSRFLESKWLFFKPKWPGIKKTIFNIGSKISHKFANLVLMCELQSNQRRPCLTWDLVFHFLTRWFRSIIGRK